MNLNLISALLVGAAVTGCGHELDSTLFHGTTSSGGLTAPQLELTCRPSEIADGAYSLKATVEGNGTSAVRLAKIGFIGTVEIDETFAAKHETILENGERHWRLSHQDFLLDLALNESHRLPVGETLRGNMNILTERFEWGPNEFKVVCSAKEANPPAEEYRAVRLAMFGMGPPVDAEAYGAMKKLIGDLVAEGTLGKYILLSHGIEGGEGSCVELDQYVKTEVLNDILASFRDIKPNPQTTSYEVTPLILCPTPAGD